MKYFIIAIPVMKDKNSVFYSVIIAVFTILNSKGMSYIIISCLGIGQPIFVGLFLITLGFLDL